MGVRTTRGIQFTEECPTKWTLLRPCRTSQDISTTNGCISICIGALSPKSNQMENITLWYSCPNWCYLQKGIMMHVTGRHWESLNHCNIGDIGFKEPGNLSKSLQTIRIYYQDLTILHHLANGICNEPEFNPFPEEKMFPIEQLEILAMSFGLDRDEMYEVLEWALPMCHVFNHHGGDVVTSWWRGSKGREWEGLGPWQGWLEMLPFGIVSRHSHYGSLGHYENLWTGHKELLLGKHAWSQYVNNCAMCIRANVQGQQRFHFVKNF